MLPQLTVEEILDICEPAPTVRLKPGEFLFHEGQDAHALYVVQSGSVRVVSGSMVYETVRAGGIVGEMALIEPDMPRSASVIAGTRAELVEINEETFLSLIASKPEFALNVMRTLSRRLRVMNQRNRSSHTPKPTGATTPIMDQARTP